LTFDRIDDVCINQQYTPVAVPAVCGAEVPHPVAGPSSSACSSSSSGPGSSSSSPPTEVSEPTQFVDLEGNPVQQHGSGKIFLRETIPFYIFVI